MTEIHFQYTPLDYRRLSQRVYQRWPLHWRWATRLGGALLGLGIVAVGIMYLRLHDLLPWTPPLYTATGLGAIALLLLVVALWVLLSRLSMRLAWRPDGNFLLPQTLRFDAQQLEFDSPRMCTRLAWSQVLARDEDAHNVYLFVDAAQAFIVPKAALAPVWADFEPLLNTVPTEFAR